MIPSSPGWMNWEWESPAAPPGATPGSLRLEKVTGGHLGPNPTTPTKNSSLVLTLAHNSGCRGWEPGIPRTPQELQGGLCQRHLEGSQVLESPRLEKPLEPTPGAILIRADADLQGLYRGFWPDTQPNNSLAVPAQPLVSSLHSSRGIPRLLGAKFCFSSLKKQPETVLKSKKIPNFLHWQQEQNPAQDISSFLVLFVGFYKNQCHLQLYNCEKAAEKLWDGSSILSNLFSINLPTQLLSPLGCQRKILLILSVWQLHRWHLPDTASSQSHFPGFLWMLPVPKVTGISVGQAFTCGLQSWKSTARR